MKKVAFFMIGCMLLLFAGCMDRDAATSSGASSSHPDMSEPASGAISQELRDLCHEETKNLFFMSALFGNWEGSPVTPDEPPSAANFSVTDIVRADDVIAVTAELYGNTYIDPASLEETIGYGLVQIWPTSNAESHAPWLAFGKSVVRFRESAGALEPVSCAYERYPHPGLDYLKAQTEELAPHLSASETIDISQYDRRLVEYIWQVLFSRRYIEKPEDITLYDLENLCDPIELPHASIYDPGTEDTWSPDYRMDASLLRLMPNLDAVYCPFRLTDYSVFASMKNLKTLTFTGVDDELFHTLEVGHTDELVLHDPDIDILDLSNVNAEALRLISWGTAVRGFTGCEKIEKLYIMSTRTDMRLVSADTFPGLRYLNLYFYSDTPRVRDFSQLSTFQNARIDLYLDYQACNNPTLESLKGVKLNDLIVNPENGSYPLQDVDRALIESLDAKRTTLGMEMYFQERTGTEESADRTLPVFSAGPDGEKVPLGIGGILHGWTLDYVEDYGNLEERINARFSGTARLKGSIRIYTDQDAPMPAGMVEFTVAQESLSQLPYYEHDTRTVWFEIANGDMIKEAAGADAGEFTDCEITINGYEYVFAPMMCWNNSIVTEVHRIG